MTDNHWTDEEEQRVAEALLAVCELHGKALTKALAKMYLKVLRRLPAPAAARSLENAFLTLKWFPKPSELLELAEGSLDEKSYHAWNVFLDIHRRVGAYSSVFFEDGRISSIIDMFGGWIECKKWFLADLQWRRAEFIRAYQAMKVSPVPHVHQGISALDNSSRGLLSFIPDPVVVDRHGKVVSVLSIESKSGTNAKLPSPDHESGIVPLDTISHVFSKLLQ